MISNNEEPTEIFDECDLLDRPYWQTRYYPNIYYGNLMVSGSDEFQVHLPKKAMPNLAIEEDHLEFFFKRINNRWIGILGGERNGTSIEAGICLLTHFLDNCRIQIIFEKEDMFGNKFADRFLEFYWHEETKQFD